MCFLKYLCSQKEDCVLSFPRRMQILSLVPATTSPARPSPWWDGEIQDRDHILKLFVFLYLFPLYFLFFYFSPFPSVPSFPKCLLCARNLTGFRGHRNVLGPVPENLSSPWVKIVYSSVAFTSSHFWHYPDALIFVVVAVVYTFYYTEYVFKRNVQSFL